MTGRPIILVVDDDRVRAASLAASLHDAFDIRITDTIEVAFNVLLDEWVQVVVGPVNTPLDTQRDFLTSVRDAWPDVVRIIACEGGCAALADRINLADVFHALSVPYDAADARMVFANAVETYRLRRADEARAIERKMAGASRRSADVLPASDIVRAATSPMNGICQDLHQIAPYDVSVLISGESGTGKELATRAIHNASLRWNKPFVVENCGALPDELLESELFGHVKGAFTGAVSDHMGLFERADGGTIFLDEIGEISPAFQVKLLRVIQEGEIRPVGGTRTRKVDVRVIAATNRDLEADVEAGRFRQDLYYRLATVTISIPALRERTMDIPVLARRLLEETQSVLGKSVRGLAAETLGLLCRYDWPGNVRELQNEIKHLVVMAADDAWLEPRQLSSKFHAVNAERPGTQLAGVCDPLPDHGPLKDRVERYEAAILANVLEQCSWNKSQAARQLGLSRVGLRAKIERYGLAGRPVNAFVEAAE